MPILKKKSASKEPSFNVGDLVQFDNDGTLVQGTVTALNRDGTVEVTDDAEDAYDIAAEDLQPREEEEERPAKAKAAKSKAKGKGKGSSLAEAFNKAKAASRGGGLPDGRYEGLVTSAEILNNEKGITVVVEAVVVNNEDDDLNGRTAQMRYMIVDDEGDPMPGMDYFKRDLAMLGVEDKFSDDDELETALSNMAEGNPWISFNAKENKQGYTNVYLNGLMEDQEDKPELPEGF